MNRRHLLRLFALAPFAAAACGSGERVLEEVGLASPPDEPAEDVVATEPAPEPPFVLEAGEGRRLLMAGTRYETPMYVFASGRPGRHVLALGGVHGNEPGGWLAAERVVDRIRPENGALVVIPRANAVAVSLFERTTDAMGDLNRSYPGFEDGKPMERMALEISNAIREFHVTLVHDMHESWSFYKDRNTNGTAFLGQTVSTNGEEGTGIVRVVVDRVNKGIQNDREELFFRDFGGPNSQNPNNNANLPRQQDVPPPGRGTSSLGLNRTFPGLVSILVEMGQQQAESRRIALHVALLEEVLVETGVNSVRRS